MFDVDGTLVESYDFDSQCLAEAVREVTGVEIDTDWAGYTHVTDAGILMQFFNEKSIKNTYEVAESVKSVFLTKIQARIDKEPVSEINGASEFITKLKERDDVVISFATGGWLESAVLKLESAGIDIFDIPIASANDHYSRVEIMKIAELKAIKESNLSFVYFGDGSWDLKACKELGVNFVLVGDKLQHYQSIKSFKQTREAIAYIGL